MSDDSEFFYDVDFDESLYTGGENGFDIAARRPAAPRPPAPRGRRRGARPR
jgi:hypothetical protein